MPTIYVTGNVNVDLIMGRLAEWPRFGTEIVLPHSETRIGGAAGNTALALQALGAEHRLIASVGDDIFGKWLQSGFVSADWVVARTETTISVGIVNPSGERTFLTSQGHLSVYGVDDVLTLLPARAAPGDILWLEGCFLSPPLLRDYERLVGEAKARGFVLGLDTGWPPDGWQPDLRRRVLGWLRSLDHLVINEFEAIGLSGEETQEAAAAALRRALPAQATLVVKRGALGASGYRGDRTIDVPAPEVAVIDTIGAGDVFDAGYLAALVKGVGLAAELRAGIAAASTAISTAPRRYR
jgi:sugar/nucleoside kinase (ribokinase family)